MLLGSWQLPCFLSSTSTLLCIVALLRCSLHPDWFCQALLTKVADKSKLVKGLGLRLAGMAKEMLADRRKIEEKFKKELARRQDVYERHLKEVSISVRFCAVRRLTMFQLLSSTVA